MATTPYSLILLVAGYAVAALGVALLVRQLRRIDWRGTARAVRVWWTSPSLDAALRTAGWMLPGVGLAFAAVAGAAPVGASVHVAVMLGLVVAPGVGAVLLVAHVLTARKSPRATTVARPARGPVASPAVGGCGGDATLIFPAVPAVTSVPGGHRAGRAAPPGVSGRPSTSGFDGATVTAPRRIWVPAPGRGCGAGTPQAPAPARPHTYRARWAGPEPGRDQTQVLAPVRDQQTETWTRAGALTPTR